MKLDEIFKGLSDPAGKPIEEFRKIRDEIEKKILELLERVKKEYYLLCPSVQTCSCEI
ncbi:low molecular weight phosphatase family protein [Caldicellulosiruptor hydrothermalis]|uniref:hypothetical protein n=1 Tax=Caldicellulosiruptor hydrothermalis TaxID=413888 RepID=UPI00030B5A97|nr:hypothetical protein [Caldicellulosiruptor hydrothermalis]